MIRNSFIFLPGVQKRTEEAIWKQDVFTWNDFLGKQSIKGISKQRKAYYDSILNKARFELNQTEHSSFFKDFFPSTETWRLYNHFKDECVFLDIEGNLKNNINIIGIYDGYDSKTFVRGINFDKPMLKKELSKFKLIITFNGSTFDIPNLKKYYADIFPDVPHIDLCHLCRKIGLSGGLKEIEARLGIRRPDHLYGSAIDAWRAYIASGNRDFLSGLIQYNEEDTVNLKAIMEHCYSVLLKEWKEKYVSR